VMPCRMRLTGGRVVPQSRLAIGATQPGDAYPQVSFTLAKLTAKLEERRSKRGACQPALLSPSHARPPAGLSRSDLDRARAIGHGCPNPAECRLGEHTIVVVICYPGPMGC
jgi:hypothetical protein